MGKNRRAGRVRDTGEASRRLAAFLRRQPAAGVHHLNPPAIALDTALPAALAALYRAFDGAEMCHEAIVLWSSSEIQRLPAGTVGPDVGECYRIGVIAGDDLAVDAHDRVYRLEADTGEWLPEGSHLARWLHGAVEAEILLYDRDGEFVDAAFEDSGEVTAAMNERMCRRILDRDRAAPAPRWRLARSLALAGRVGEAREHLERVVAQSRGFAWAWFDLARISEGLGDAETALEELLQAVACRPDYEHAGFLYAHAARLAAALGREGERARLADEALARDPMLLRTQRDGAQAMLDEDEPQAALELAQLAAALAPRDLAVLDLLARARRVAGVPTTRESR